jgi:hypothetical protein
MPGVFINYRTGDGNQAAAFIAQHLISEFGDQQVFLDSTSLPAGEPFPAELERRLVRSTVLLVVIGPHWLTLSDGRRRRIDNPGDYVRYEIELSLQRRITVLPLLLDDTPLPKPQDLPPQIVDLVNYQWRRIRSRELHRDLTELVEFLRTHLPVNRPTSPDPVGNSPVPTAPSQYVERGIISTGTGPNTYTEYHNGRPADDR